METKESFVKFLKKGDLDQIVNKHKIFDKKTKVNLIADNICSLKFKTIEKLLQLYEIKYTAGTKMPLYVKAVDCSEQIFGFITSYYSVDKQTRIYAYERALKLNKVNILKRIRDIDPKMLKKLRDYTEKTPGINKETKDFIASDYIKSSSRKDTSPEDLLKKKLKREVKKKISALQQDLNKIWKFK
jgi:hypothetical protein